MIELTTLAGKPILVNPDVIRFCESTPDTIVCFMDGTRLPVKENFSEVKEKVLEFKRQQKGT
jgi:flagellar protein FlbD